MSCDALECFHRKEAHLLVAVFDAEPLGGLFAAVRMGPDAHVADRVCELVGGIQERLDLVLSQDDCGISSNCVHCRNRGCQKCNQGQREWCGDKRHRIQRADSEQKRRE